MFPLRKPVLLSFVVLGFWFCSTGFAESFSAETGKFGRSSTIERVPVGCSYGALSKVQIKRLGVFKKKKRLRLETVYIYFAAGQPQKVEFSGKILTSRGVDILLNRQACIEHIDVKARTSRVGRRASSLNYRALIFAE